MTPRLTSILVASLLGSAALTPVAMAQDTASQSGQGCEALRTLIEDHQDQLRDQWITQANDIAATGDATQCAELHQQASAELGLEQSPDQQTAQGQQGGAQDQQDETESAQIVVTQPDPNVTIEQDAPQVAVSQPQPQVSIDQGQPEILVRQQAPTVSVQIPQPVITIDQPQPEIIIRMPDPRVAVTSPQPQVEVRQGEPRVTVEQAEPRVSVRSEDQPGGANVDVEQGQPDVQLQTAEGQPRVDIQRQEPKVSFQAAEPNIDVQMQGEPEIRFSQTGEPTVRFEEQGEQSQQTAEAGQQRDAQPEQPDQQVAQSGQQQPTDQAQPGQVDSQELAEAGPDLDQQQNQQPDQQVAQSAAGQQAQQPVDEIETGSIQQDEASARPEQQEMSVAALIMSNGQQLPEGEMQDYAASDLIGKQLLNQDQVELGTVEMLVEAGGERYVVLSADSVLADGSQGVVLPLDNIQMSDDALMLRGLTEEEYARLQEYDASGAQEIAADERLQLATL